VVPSLEALMLVVIGCGNLNRQDDGVGIRVIQQLQQQYPEAPEWLRLYDAGTAGMEVMFQARGCDTLILIDACLSDSEPGAIFEVPGEELESAPKDSFNLHDFRWDHALYAGRQIFREDFPEHVRVFLIEAEHTGFGLELSPRVAEAATRVAEKVQAHLSEYAKTHGLI
jgi:hydrogenase maturation protease